MKPVKTEKDNSFLDKMDKVSSILKWKTDRRAPEDNIDGNLSDDTYFYLLIFFVIFSFLMIGLYVMIICIGFYRSMTDTARKVSRENSSLIEEV